MVGTCCKSNWGINAKEDAKRRSTPHTIVVACEESNYEALVASNASFHTSKKPWIANVFVSWNNLHDHPTLECDHS